MIQASAGAALIGKPTTLLLTYLHSFYPLDTEPNFTINSKFTQQMNNTLPPMYGGACDNLLLSKEIA